MIDTYCASYKRAPRAVTLDIDDTLDVVHGHQQLSLFNARQSTVGMRTSRQQCADLPRMGSTRFSRWRAVMLSRIVSRPFATAGGWLFRTE
jgi:Transposase DDE domain group 1